MEKNTVITGTADGYTFEGAGVVRTDGIVLFVPGLLDQEEAEIAVTAVKKTYGYGRVLKILKPSIHRIEPECSAYRLCGGCQLLHMDMQEQHRFKQQKVKDCFLKNAHMDLDILPVLSAGDGTRYRNKVQVPVQVIDGKVKMGFYRNHTNEIIEYDRCLVQTDRCNEIVASFRTWLQELDCGKAFRHVLIKHAHVSNQIMIVMIVREYPFHNCEQLNQRLLEKYPEIVSLQALINRRSDNVILDGEEVLISGKPYIEEELLGCTFRISARSFYQINPETTAVLYQTALDFADLKPGDIVIDLYCGTGTIGILASRHVKKVYGIEIAPDAVKDARINAERNSIENIEFVTADAWAGAQRVIRSRVHADTVIVDPPRKGCSVQTLDAIAVIAPKRLVYVSCDPATLARDCALMKDRGYEVQKVQPVDMFPNTEHIETIVLLQRSE